MFRGNTRSWYKLYALHRIVYSIQLWDIVSGAQYGIHRIAPKNSIQCTVYNLMNAVCRIRCILNNTAHSPLYDYFMQYYTLRFPKLNYFLPRSTHLLTYSHICLHYPLWTLTPGYELVKLHWKKKRKEDSLITTQLKGWDCIWREKKFKWIGEAVESLI